MSAPWWRSTTIYQVYPRSFQDTNGDGVGDLEGVRRRLPYLAETLGVGTIWLSPFYPSPMADFGYDVADYTDVDPMFGTLDDFDALLADAHRLGLRILVDWVPNHTSDAHPWFVESRRDRTNPKRGWYVWRDPKPDGSPPNNWISNFGGPAWDLDERTGQYYLHSFAKEQPDLDWRNPEVKAAMFDGLRFWLDRGVDGFRIDVAHTIGKDPQLRDNPPAPDTPRGPFKSMGPYDSLLHLYDKDDPYAHEVYRDVRLLLDEYEPERLSVGEIHLGDWQKWAAYYGEDLDELSMPLSFGLIHTDWDAAAIRRHVEKLEAAVPEGAWPNHVLGNHDETRLATRVGQANVRVAAMLLLTLRGTPTLYYGDELGIPEAPIPADEQMDPHGRNVPGAGRDGCRTPMQWDPSAMAGFATPGTTAPWLPRTPDWRTRNVETQLADRSSLLALYRRLLRLRQDHPALSLGDYRSVDGTPDGIYAYERSHGSERWLVALNLTDIAQQLAAPAAGRIALSTAERDLGSIAPGTSLTIAPHEGLIIELDEG